MANKILLPVENQITDLGSSSKRFYNIVVKNVYVDTINVSSVLSTDSIVYDNTQSGATSTTLQSAIDEVYDNLLNKKSTVTALENNLTINFTTSTTLTDAIAAISAVPKNLNGYTLTIQFANGTYAWASSTPLYIRDFYNGNIYLLGDPSQNTKSSGAENVILQVNQTQLQFVSNNTYVYVKSIRFNLMQTDTNTWTSALYIAGHNGIYEIMYCSFQNNTSVKTSNCGIYVQDTNAFVRIVNCCFYWLARAVVVAWAIAHVEQCVGGSSTYIGSRFQNFYGQIFSYSNWTSGADSIGVSHL